MIHVIQPGIPLIIKGSDEKYTVLHWNGNKFKAKYFNTEAQALKVAEAPVIYEKKEVIN